MVNDAASVAHTVGALAARPIDPACAQRTTHSEDQVAQIAGSIAEFGFVNPILVGDDGVSWQATAACWLRANSASPRCR
jgi:hypothetical protein